MAAPTRIYYPAWRRHLNKLQKFMQRNQSEMINKCNITGTELSQLQSLYADLTAITGNPNFPKYREQP